MRTLGYLSLESQPGDMAELCCSHHDTFCQSLQAFLSSDLVGALLTSAISTSGDQFCRTVVDFAGHVQKQLQIRSDSHARLADLALCLAQLGSQGNKKYSQDSSHSLSSTCVVDSSVRSS